MIEELADPLVPLSSAALDPASEKLIADRASKDADRLRQFLNSRNAQGLSDEGAALRQACSLLAPKELLDLVRNPYYTFWWRRLMGHLARKDSAGVEAWVPELSRLLAAALLKPGSDVTLHCQTDAKGELALPTLSSVLIGLASDVPVALRPAPDGGVSVSQGDAHIIVPPEAFRGLAAHPNLRNYQMIPGSQIALDASDPWVDGHFRALNAEPAEHPYPKRDLAADLAPQQIVMDHFARALHLVDEVWPSLGREMRDDISYIFPFSSELILGWADLRFRGAVFINSGPDDLVFYTERLVHEAAHIRLFATDRIALHNDPPTRKISSPFRKDARPVTGLLHAAFVYARLIDLFVRLDKEGVPGFGRRVVEVAPKFRDCADSLLSQARLTPSGRYLVEELSARVQGTTNL